MVLQRWAGSYGGKSWGLHFSETTAVFLATGQLQKGKEIWSRSSKEHNGFSTREGLILGSFVHIITLVSAQSCSQSWKWLFLPSCGLCSLPPLQWPSVPHYVGSRCVISRTWHHNMTKKSESYQQPTEIDGTEAFSIAEYVSKCGLRKLANECPKDKKKMDRTQSLSEDKLWRNTWEFSWCSILAQKD